jgi:hypothetical protein
MSGTRAPSEKEEDRPAYVGRYHLGIEGYDTYRVYDPRSGKVEIVRNVQFDESQFPAVDADEYMRQPKGLRSLDRKTRCVICWKVCTD